MHTIIKEKQDSITTKYVMPTVRVSSPRVKHPRIPTLPFKTLSEIFRFILPSEYKGQYFRGSQKNSSMWHLKALMAQVARISNLVSQNKIATSGEFATSRYKS